MNRPAPIAPQSDPHVWDHVRECPPFPATRHLTALDTAEDIHTHMRLLKAKARAEHVRAVVAISVFVLGVTVLALAGVWLLRAGIIVAQVP